MAVGFPVEELSDMSNDSSSSSLPQYDISRPPLGRLSVGAIRKISLRANPEIYHSYGIYFKECNFDLKVRGQKLVVKFFVDEVVEDSDAHLAGITKGDVILELTCNKLRTERERKCSASSRSVRRRKSMNNNDQAMACDPTVYDPNYGCNEVLSNDTFVVHGIDVTQFESFVCTMPSIIIDVIYIKADEWSALSDKKTRLERDFREKKLKVENHERHIEEIEKGILRRTDGHYSMYASQSPYSGGGESSKRLSGSSALKDKIFKRNSIKYSSRSMSQPDLLASEGGLQTLPRKGKSSKKDSVGSNSNRDASTPRVMEKAEKRSFNKSLKNIHSYFTGPSSSSSGYGTLNSRSSNGDDDDTICSSSSQCSSVRSSGVGSITPTNSFNFTSKKPFGRRPLLSSAHAQDNFVPSHRFNPNQTAPPYVCGPKLDADFCQSTLPRNFKHKTNIDSSRMGVTGPKELPGQNFHFASNVKSSNFAASYSHPTSSSSLRSSTPKRAAVGETVSSGPSNSASPGSAILPNGDPGPVRSSPPSIIRLNSTGHDSDPSYMINGVPHQFEDINEDVDTHFSDSSFERRIVSDNEKQPQLTNAAVVPVDENHIQSYSNIEASHRPKTLLVGRPMSEGSNNNSGPGVNTSGSSGGSRTSSEQSQQDHPSVHTPVINLPKQTRIFCETQL